MNKLEYYFLKLVLFVMCLLESNLMKFDSITMIIKFAQLYSSQDAVLCLTFKKHSGWGSIKLNFIKNIGFAQLVDINLFKLIFFRCLYFLYY